LWGFTVVAVWLLATNSPAMADPADSKADAPTSGGAVSGGRDGLPAAGESARAPKRDNGSTTGRVLIDAIHVHEFSHIGLKPGVCDYHEHSSFRLAFDYLRSRGVTCDRVAQGRLHDELLSQYRLLVINLASADCPSFLVSEIAAIKRFVERGGSLFIVTDHSNAYGHAYILEPLLTELGIASYTDTICEVAPHILGNGNGWIAVTRFSPHPLTEGLKCLGILTGGRVDSRYAVAWTSDGAWADAWKPGLYLESNTPGFLGDFQRDPKEKSGRLGVVLAKTLGRGRIVIIPDQNMLGDAFINYADNYRLWLNAAAWLLDDPKLRDPAGYERWHAPRLMLYDEYEHAVFGTAETAGSYYAFVLLSRYHWTFAGERLELPADLLVFAHNEYLLPDDRLAAVVAHLRRGKDVLVLNSMRDYLTADPSFIRRVLHEMGIESPTCRECRGMVVFDTTAGAGKIFAVAPNILFDNRELPAPTNAAPTVQQKNRSQQLLDAVDEALGKKSGQDSRPKRAAAN
jgi:hypothetical protein